MMLFAGFLGFLAVLFVANSIQKREWFRIVLSIVFVLLFLLLLVRIGIEIREDCTEKSMKDFKFVG